MWFWAVISGCIPRGLAFAGRDLWKIFGVPRPFVVESERQRGEMDGKETRGRGGRGLYSCGLWYLNDATFVQYKHLISTGARIISFYFSLFELVVTQTC